MDSFEEANQHYCSLATTIYRRPTPANCGGPQQKPARTQAQSAAGGLRAPKAARACRHIRSFRGVIRPFHHQLSQYKWLPSAPSWAKRNICKASTLRDMQRIILDRRSLADAVLSSTINHNTIAPMFLTGCERICDPLVLRAILMSACLGSSSVVRSAGNGAGRGNTVRQSS